MNNNLNILQEIGNGFQALLYVRFIIEKKYRVSDCAERMGIAPDTLYRYIRGENLFPVERAGALTQATGDPGYLQYVADQAGFIVVPKPQPRPNQLTIEQVEIDCEVELGRLLDLISKKRGDDLTKKDIAAIMNQGTEVERQVEYLKAMIQRCKKEE